MQRLGIRHKALRSLQAVRTMHPGLRLAVSQPESQPCHAVSGQQGQQRMSGKGPLVQARALPSNDVGGDGSSLFQEPSSQPSLWVKGLVDLVGLTGAVLLVNTGPAILVSRADVPLMPVGC